MTEPVDPFNQSPPSLAYDDTLPKLERSWKGWQLFRGETWMEDDGGPIMFKWTAKGLSLICEGDTYGEDDLILVPPGQLCSCWRQRPCKAHREPSALEVEPNGGKKA